ncbi:helix-turn-helix domain-containing protein [Microbacterium hominis]|uniref:helix-turn-helix domain-containing protein n=1 Tax=Microbacterium hominis TaxID=162426 RepID=UPI001963CAF0|nr:helix-turn-helix domain-containing protein [Microbacterium hominis]QRY40574.1 helix-turn-helix domain-containing protein [Microbacterium hominis]
MSEPSHGCCEQNLDDAVAVIETTAKTKSGASPRGETPLSTGSYEVTCSEATDVVAPSEALSINSRPLLALRDALGRGEIQRVLQGPLREHVAGTRSLRQMTPELLERVVSDYRSGLSVYAIAEKHGIHRQTVTNHLVDAGITLRRTITDSERQRARELYDSGAYIKDIAKVLHRNPATIAKLVRPDRVSVPCPHA